MAHNGANNGANNGADNRVYTATPIACGLAEAVFKLLEHLTSSSYAKNFFFSAREGEKDI